MPQLTSLDLSCMLRRAGCTNGHGCHGPRLPPWPNLLLGWLCAALSWAVQVGFVPADGTAMRADNRIGNAGATDFARCLVGMTHLKKLDLSSAPHAALVHARWAWKADCGTFCPDMVTVLVALVVPGPGWAVFAQRGSRAWGARSRAAVLAGNAIGAAGLELLGPTLPTAVLRLSRYERLPRWQFT
jgi:hypothetical protein